MASDGFSALVRAKITSMLAEASAEDKAQFKVLWENDILPMINAGRVVLFFPRKMGAKLGCDYLKELALNLSGERGETVHVHYVIGKNAYRVGNIKDDDVDTNFILIHSAEYPPTVPVEQNNSHQASPFDHLQSYGAFDFNHFPAAANFTSPPKKTEKIPKPRNSWIIYRQDKHSVVLAENPGMHTSKISTIIADLWRNEPADVRTKYKDLADQEKASHQIMYPAYKCSPRKSSEIKKRKRQSKDINIEGLPTSKAARLVEQSGPQLSPLQMSFSPQLPTSLIPPTQQGPPKITWQPFELYSGMNNGLFGQPSDELFFDEDVMQMVDWSAHGVNWS